MQPKIWLSPPHMGGMEQKYIQEAFDSNWIAPLGHNVDEFERTLAEFTGAGNVLALSSGTAAIHLALIVLGVGYGDEVIASTFTFSATVNPIVYQGATPVLVDSETDTWNINPEFLEKAILDRIKKGKKPKAIIVVHLYGMPAMMDEIMEIANRFDIPVVEDAAEALGSKYKNKQVGTFGKLGILSFNGNKIITTSGGGALIADDADLISKARNLSMQARDDAPYYQHSKIGYNYRLSNVCAGIGLGQMEVINQRIRQRRTNYSYYVSNLKSIKGLQFQSEPDPNYFSNHWITTILVDPKLMGGFTAEDLRLALEKEGIESRPLWKPMHLQPVFSECPYYGNGISEKLFQSGLCLPSGSNLSDSDKTIIIDSMKKSIS